ncbi:MAG: FxsA family protein [Pseudomonadota bacterium]
MPLFLALMIVPLIEIGLFIEVGGLIGLWPTILIVIATALLGSVLLRAQGLDALRRVQNSLSPEGDGDPVTPLAHGAMILVAGVVLLTPGFFTDAIGFALLVPAVRSFVIRRVGARMRASAQVHTQAYGTPHGYARPAPAQNDVVEGDYTVAPEAEAPRDPNAKPSGWVRDGQ